MKKGIIFFVCAVCIISLFAGCSLFQEETPLTKTLCEMVVAKVPTDDFLGKSFSW